jgi:tetraacyldisaccharide 4'-kinase
VHFPDSPSPLRKTLLAPAALAYAAGSFLHRALWLRPRNRDRTHLLPLVVIGSLRAGGAGKTAVTLELARHLSNRGLRVGVLAYAIRRRDPAEFSEVFPDSDWRASSDEAVLLTRGLAECGARVFVTRDRERAWTAFSRMRAFDVILSDDGLMDARLTGAFKVVLTRPGENPGWRDLLPAGPFRLTASARKEADVVLREGEGFTRTPLPPEGLFTEKPGWIMCGLGSPARFLRSLEDAGIKIAGISAGPDHGLPHLARAHRYASHAGTDRFLCSEKDWIKLESHSARPENLVRIGEKITLSPDFLKAVEAFLAAPTS